MFFSVMEEAILALFVFGIFIGFVDNNKKIKQCQTNHLKSKLVDLGGEGITYSVISHSDTILGTFVGIQIQPIKNSAFGLY